MYIKTNEYNEKERLKNESIFNCASGKLGIRGCFEEGTPNNEISIRGAYINGFCEDEEITYNEKLYGFPTTKQTIANLPDAQGIEIYADNEKLTCWSNNSSNFNYALNMEEGLVERSFEYQTNKGKIVLSFERLSSFVRQGLFVIKANIKSLDYKGHIEIKSYLQGDVRNFTNSSDPRVASGSGKMLNVISAENTVNDISIQKVEVETINSHRKATVEVVNDISKSNFVYEKENNLLTAKTGLDLSEGEEVTIIKYCHYSETTSNNLDESFIKNAYKDGYEIIKNEQKQFMNSFWNSSRVLIDCDDIKQENIDFCLYEMLSAAGRDGLTSIAAKGLSGEGYEGHYFWDCETYIYPFFSVTDYDCAKSLLKYRYSKLDEAKKHARTLGHNSGALYPWRTITGSECSSYFPSGSAQYHINGDIARAFDQYWNITEDREFLPEICEVLLETARLWIDVGHYEDDKFKIDCVTGPDEYTCVVNNNYYTNAGAANNLRKAAKLINILKQTSSYDEFVKKTNVNDEELQEFVNAANKMYYPYDEKLGIIKQDDSFLDKKKLDLKSIPEENFPLLLHYHPLFLNRHQVCKQADAVLANYLFTKLNASTSMRTFEYYDEITTHDSSLSKCIFGIMAARLGDLSKAKKYFIETLNTDLDDHKGNTRDGLHIANMGGCYRMILGGFAGLDIDENGLSIFPMIPHGFRSYSFTIRYKGSPINIYVDKEKTKINLLDTSKNIDINVYGENIVLDKKETIVKRTCKGVIFDLDGVVTDTAIYHYEAWKKIADEFGVEFNKERNEEFKGVSRATCLEKLLKWGNIKLNKEEFDKTLIRKNDYYKELLNNLTPQSVLPGIKEGINALHNKGIKVALFSVSKNTNMILEKLEIEDLFDVKVTGEDIVNSKPHYEGYLLAADRMGLDPKVCMMVEDSEAGIKGAKALSLKTIAIMKENIANADYCFYSTDALKDIDKYL